MSKKLLMSLTPLLATVAFVAMPALAQAASPHWGLSNPGVAMTAGVSKQTVSWGELGFESEKKAAFTCQNVVLGDIENPTGGGPGVGQTEVFAPYDCIDPECPETSGIELQVRAERLPWGVELIEPTPPEVKIKSSGVEFQILCVVKGVINATDPDDPELAAAGATCTGTVPGAHDGVSTPKAINGSGAGSENPSKVQFGAAAGLFECGAESGKGKTAKTLKSMEYENKETVESVP